MIGRYETTLSQVQYDVVNTGNGPFVSQVFVRPYSFSFSAAPGTFPTGVGNNFYAWILSQSIIVAYVSGGNLYSVVYDISAGTWGSATQLDTGVSDVRPAGDGTAVYYVKNDGVWWVNYQGGTQTLIIDSTDAEMAKNGVGSTGSIDLITKESTWLFIAIKRSDNNMTLLAKNTSNTDPAIASEIYWPFKFLGLDAAYIPGTSNIAVAVSSDLPPLISKSASGTNVYDVVERRNGIVSFVFSGKRFSDHFVVDAMDDASVHQYRGTLSISALPNAQQPKVVIVAYGKDGNETNSHEALHYYYSADGKAWEVNQMITGIPDITHGAFILPTNTYTYLVTQTELYRSLSTEHTAPRLLTVGSENITPKVLQYSSSQGPVRQSELVLKDDGWFAGSILSGDGVKTLEIDLGYFAPGYGGVLEPALVRFSREIIDSITVEEQTPDRRITVKSRDAYSLLNNRTHSPHSLEFDTQTVGADNFYDSTNTGYGGLRHVAGVEGSWKTDGGTLILRSNNKRGVAYNTFKTDTMWNGMLEAKLRIDTPSTTPASPGEKEFIGFVVRAYDAQNYIAVKYIPDEDKLGLFFYENGSETEQNSILNAGFGYGTDFWLRVVFRYSSIAVFTSTDGSSFTLRFSSIIPGDSSSYSNPPEASKKFQAGMVGYAGLGYGEDSWPTNIYAPPDNRLPFYTYNWGLGTKSGILALRTHRQYANPSWNSFILTTGDLQNGPWEIFHDGLPASALQDGPTTLVLDPFNFDKAYWIIGGGDIYATDNWRSKSPWYLAVSSTDVHNAVKNAHGGEDFLWYEDAAVTMAREGIIVMAARTKYGDTGNEGSLALVRVNVLTGQIDVSPVMRIYGGNYTDSGLKHGSVAVGSHDGNFVAATAGVVWGSEHKSLWTCDWNCTGSDWSCFDTFVSNGFTYWKPSVELVEATNSSHTAHVIIPWTKLDGTDNIEEQIIMSGHGDKIFVSNDKGQSLAPLTNQYMSAEAADAGSYWCGGTRRDTFENNTTNGTWFHFIRDSRDVAVPDKLYISQDGGQTWTQKDLPYSKMIGWTGGFPAKNGQLYIGASTWCDGAMAYEDGKYPWNGGLTNRDMIIMFSSDGGTTWVDWTHNLWALIRNNLPPGDDKIGVGVIRLWPHPLEK